jgi:hypothetical protein
LVLKDTNDGMVGLHLYEDLLNFEKWELNIILYYFKDNMLVEDGGLE